MNWQADKFVSREQKGVFEFVCFESDFMRRDEMISNLQIKHFSAHALLLVLHKTTKQCRRHDTEVEVPMLQRPATQVQKWSSSC